ncbi:MAG: site-specific DNA-methyltransferase [Ignavibacteriae bacterium]|nr:site-specific DNA-methyltransferase [Ignavibacteriota bacterium]
MNSKYNKLELCWPGKDIEVKPEPRVLIEDPEKSYGEANTENMLIHADNLLALKALEQKFTERIKCIYIDPPYNTGQAFEHYEDGLEHSIWLSLMRDRINVLRKLLKSDGVFFCQVNDDEMAYAKVLLDEVFGRDNFLNTVSAKMKQTSGASGGGEDKKLKKNIEYIHIYSKDKNNFKQFNEVYDEVDLFELIEEMRENGKSWKYTRVIYGIEKRVFLKEIVDGSGQPIKIYKHNDIKYKTITELMAQDNLSEEDCYIKYYDKIFRDTNAQSSIRTRVMEATVGDGDFFSIDYTPKSGKNKNKLTTQYYKGNNRDLIAWLKDVCVKKGNKLLKLEKAGTFWEGFPLNNLTKEGNVKFPNGKKPEALIQKVLELATDEDDFVLDSFLGSGTTAAVAHKMKRKYIGIELGEHCNTHCLPRLKIVCDGTDQGGVSKIVEWKGGSGFKFYELAPSLLNKDKYNQWVINPNYNAQLLAAAMARHEGFTYFPSESVVWKQGYATENHFIFTTTNTITPDVVEQILSELKPDESLRICCTAFVEGCNDISPRIEIKKIPAVLLGKCEFGKEDYCTENSIINMPADPDKPAFTPSYVKPEVKPSPAKINKSQPMQTNLLF